MNESNNQNHNSINPFPILQLQKYCISNKITGNLRFKSKTSEYSIVYTIEIGENLVWSFEVPVNYLKTVQGN